MPDFSFEREVRTPYSEAYTIREDDRPVGRVDIHFADGGGSARLREYGSGEPSITPGQTPGTSKGSQTNPDPFFHTNPYQEPIFETRLECNPGFAWQNSACSLASIPDLVRNRVAAATPRAGSGMEICCKSSMGISTSGSIGRYVC